MGNVSLIAAALAASLLISANVPKEVLQLYDDTILAGQQLATAGDLRSMTQMLEIHYLKHGRYPKTEAFDAWLEATFGESHLKPLRQDHWGNDYHYLCHPGRKACELRSLGPDGIADTADDMLVRRP